MQKFKTFEQLIRMTEKEIVDYVTELDKKYEVDNFEYMEWSSCTLVDALDELGILEDWEKVLEKYS
ncbi:hypothetical protein P9850_01970 [Anoxybacillus rupiensis]|uniref:Acyl carrier protein n=1 Tax=Anoxybacteroides rupiense TaxID=311460 RepID=A0ABD5IQU3_9BACL|nr:hypothetical protein [Anoxybacillus rupiensis]